MNEALIPSVAPGQGVGAVYDLYDANAVPGLACYYTLEDVDRNGLATRHGPIEIKVARIYLPLLWP